MPSLDRPHAWDDRARLSPSHNHIVGLRLEEARFGNRLRVKRWIVDRCAKDLSSRAGGSPNARSRMERGPVSRR